MPEEKTSVKTTPVPSGPEVSATSFAEHDKQLAKEFGMDEPTPGVKEAEPVSTGADPQEEPEPESPETPAKDGTQEPEPEQPAEEPDKKPEPEPELEKEPEPEKPSSDSPRANKRIRSLVEENKELKAERERLLAIARGEIKPEPANGTQPNPPQQPQRQEPSTQEWRRYIADLEAAQANGQQVSGSDVTPEMIEWARGESQKQMIREVQREERQREQQVRATVTQREWVVNKCMSLKARDPRFTLLDRNGQLSQTPFAQAVKTQFEQNGGRTIQDCILAAYEVADQVKDGDLELAQVQAAQATQQTRKAIQRTSLATPPNARTAGGKPKPPVKSGPEELQEWMSE